jgi:hypothetical protein
MSHPAPTSQYLGSNPGSELLRLQQLCPGWPHETNKFVSPGARSKMRSRIAAPMNEFGASQASDAAPNVTAAMAMRTPIPVRMAARF